MIKQNIKVKVHVVKLRYSVVFTKLYFMLLGNFSDHFEEMTYMYRD